MRFLASSRFAQNSLLLEAFSVADNGRRKAATGSLCRRLRRARRRYGQSLESVGEALYLTWTAPILVVRS